MDIDFLAKQITNEHEAMKRAVETIMMQETGNDYIQFTIKNIENIAEQKAYHGVRVKMITTISNTKTPFDIDIGIGDVIIPSENELEIPTPVSYTHLRAHETRHDLVCRLLLEKKNTQNKDKPITMRI